MVSSKFLLLGFSTIDAQIIDAWRLATSNDPWGPTGTEMSEIAHMTFETLVTSYWITMEFSGLAFCSRS